MTMEPNGIRPDPDELLKQVEDEERKQARGKLKVFLGYSAGVGKDIHHAGRGADSEQ